MHEIRLWVMFKLPFEGKTAKIEVGAAMPDRGYDSIIPQMESQGGEELCYNKGGLVFTLSKLIEGSTHDTQTSLPGA